MAARFQLFQTNGAGAGVDTPLGLGDGSHDLDFKRNDRAGLFNALEDDPIIAGGFSCQVYLRARFTHPADAPPFSSITNVRLYTPDLNLSGLGDGAYLLANAEASYPGSPDTASMSGTWAPIPEVPASGIDLSTASLASGVEGWTKWAGLQLKTTNINPDPGSAGLIPLTVVYDEV